MEIKKRPTAAVIGGAILAWQLVLQPIWNLNVEKFAEQNNLDTTLSGGSIMTSVSALFDFLPSSFATGFAVGALIFAYWDWLASAVRRKVRPSSELGRVRAWAANLSPSMDQKAGTISIWMQVICVGDLPFRIAGVEGTISLKADNGSKKRVTYTIDNIRYALAPTEKLVTLGMFAGLSIEMDAPRQFLANMPDVMFWKPYPLLEFSDLTIWLETESGLKKRLTLWDSMRLSSGDWQIKGVETFPLFKTEEERETLQKAIGAVVKRFGVKL